MVWFARYMIFALLVLTFVGGPTLHLAQPAEYAVAATMADMPCGQMMPGTDNGSGTPMMPCKGMTADCLKQMGCVADVGLPTRSMALDVVLAYAKIDYWSAFPHLAGVVRQPEPQPPRTV